MRTFAEAPRFQAERCNRRAFMTLSSSSVASCFSRGSAAAARQLQRRRLETRASCMPLVQREYGADELGIEIYDTDHDFLLEPGEQRDRLAARVQEAARTPGGTARSPPRMSRRAGDRCSRRGWVSLTNFDLTNSSLLRARQQRGRVDQRPGHPRGHHPSVASVALPQDQEVAMADGASLQGGPDLSPPRSRFPAPS